VSWCLEEAGIPSTRSAASRSYLTWGVSIGRPILGAICVFRRGKDERFGHVGFAMYETSTHIGLLGGNQRNSVCVLEYPKADLLGIRMPPDDYWDPYTDESNETDSHLN